MTNVFDGTMRSGPKGRVVGFRPYPWMLRSLGRVARLRTFAVEVRDGAIWFTE